MSEKSYLPPQSPILIQPGDKGFETVGKAYNRMIWTFPDWAKKKKKIVDPGKLWGKYGTRMTKKEQDQILKNAYLESDSENTENTGISESEQMKNNNHPMEKRIFEKSVSSAQQRLMGQAWALRKGEIDADDINPEYREAIEKIAFGKMTDKELIKFAETKTKSLPHHVSGDGIPAGPAGVKETASPKQIPSNYIGEVPGGDAQMKVVPYFNWDASKGKMWWQNTGNKSSKKLRFVKEYEDFFQSDDIKITEMNIQSRSKVDELIDFLKQTVSPFEFRTIHNLILGLVIDTMIPDYESFFSEVKRSIPEAVLSSMPDHLKN